MGFRPFIQRWEAGVFLLVGFAFRTTTMLLVSVSQKLKQLRDSSNALAGGPLVKNALSRVFACASLSRVSTRWLTVGWCPSYSEVASNTGRYKYRPWPPHARINPGLANTYPHIWCQIVDISLPRATIGVCWLSPGGVYWFVIQ